MLSKKQLDKVFKKKALKSTVKSFKLVAIAFSESGHLITSAVNMRGGGSISKWTTHAEEALIRKLIKISARNRYGEIAVVVARWSPTKGWAMAKPCCRCEALLSEYGATALYYTSNNEVIRHW